MTTHTPNVIIIAGPNGAGKTTTAPALLRDVLDVPLFVNADVIAQGLSGFSPESAAVQAGRIMLERLKALAAENADFAFETTLAARSYAAWIRGLQKAQGYALHIVFLWLPSPEMALARVRSRVCRGGHDIPEEVVRRRYEAGLRNFFTLYMPLTASWRFYDNSRNTGPRLLAMGSGERVLEAPAPREWADMRARYGREEKP